MTGFLTANNVQKRNKAPYGQTKRQNGRDINKPTTMNTALKIASGVAKFSTKIGR